MASTQQLTITTPDGTATAILAEPETGPGSAPERSGPHPGVLLVMDAFGLRPRITEMAERIADAGYVVLAPNVFYRAGDDPVGPMPDLTQPGARDALFARLRPLMAELTPENLASDSAAYLDTLAERAVAPFAITGYCMGGRVALSIAAAHPDRVAAVGAFHAGGLVTHAPDSPHRLVQPIRAELLFGFADNDGSMTPEQIGEFEHALDEAGIRYSSDIYEHAAHGYTMSDTPAYDAEATERHFSELLGLLERALPDVSAAR